MKTRKTRLSELAKQIGTREEQPISQKEAKPIPQTLNLREDKSDSIKISVMLPPDVYKLLLEESTRRKIARERDASISGIIRDTLVRHL
jgi:transcriptional regulator of met regulon